MHPSLLAVACGALAAAILPGRAAEPLKATLLIEAPHALVIGAASANATLKLFSWERGEKNLEVRATMKPWGGERTALPPQTVAFKGDANCRFEVPMKAFGPNEIEVEVREAGVSAPIATAKARLIKIPALTVLSRQERAGSSMGVNVHQGSFFKELTALGLHWGRDYSGGWLSHWIFPKDGSAPTPRPVANGVDFIELWNRVDAGGMSILPCLQKVFQDKDKRRFLDDPDKIRRAYALLGKTFKDMPWWELDNEADGGWGIGPLDPANYQNYIRAAAAGLKDSGGAGRVILNGTAGIFVEDTEELLASPVKDDFAVVNYHHYTGTIAPEIAKLDINLGREAGSAVYSFTDHLRRINRVSHAAGKEAWLTEVGWDVTYGPAVGEELQTLYLPRAWVLARWCGTDKVFWFFDRDGQGKQKFSSCGLFDLEGNARPSAAATAALSQFTARARMAGAVDLGDDAWCILFQDAKRWVAVAWCLEGNRPAPAGLASAEAFDLFGNPCKPGLSPSVTYFVMEKPPRGWEWQAATEMATPTNFAFGPGDTAEVIFQIPQGATFAWSGLPSAVTAAPAEASAGGMIVKLTAKANAPLGSFPVRVTASGPEAKKSWRMVLHLQAPLVVGSAPWEKGRPAAIEILPITPGERVISLSVEAKAGAVSPSEVRARRESPGKAAFTASEIPHEPLPLRLRLSTGATQSHWLRPLEMLVPRVRNIAIDGRLDDWSKAARLGPEWFAKAREGFAPEARLAWGPDGLWVGGRIPARGIRSADPKKFWEHTCFEIFVDTGDASSAKWGPTLHQFWVSPVKEGGAWRASAGEWKRGEAIPASIFDDPRGRSAIAVDGEGMTVEWLVPVAALGGKAPSPGTTWRAAVCVRSVADGEILDAAWPRPKSQGILDGSAAWGVLRFSHE